MQNHDDNSTFIALTSGIDILNVPVLVSFLAVTEHLNYRTGESAFDKREMRDRLVDVVKCYLKLASKKK